MPAILSGEEARRFQRGAVSRGVPVELIKAQGDCQSNAYERYLENSFSNRLKAITIVARNVK